MRRSYGTRGGRRGPWIAAAVAAAVFVQPTRVGGESGVADGGFDPDAGPDGGVPFDGGPGEAGVQFDGGPREAGVPEAGPSDAGEPDGDAGGHCGTGPACNPGLECFEVDDGFRCGLCLPGDVRDCNDGCGPGQEVCNPDLYWSGQCIPFQEVECVRGDTQPCESECGAGHRNCNPQTCQWFDECLSDVAVQCLPGTTSGCATAVGCPGTMTCDQVCQWGDCVADGYCAVCGDGVLDEGGGEECDDGNELDGDGCAWNCELEGPLPFRSCDCSLPGTPSHTDHPVALALAGLAAICLRRRRRFR